MFYKKSQEFTMSTQTTKQEINSHKSLVSSVSKEIKEEIDSAQLSTKKILVVKRIGSIAPFDPERIACAIEAAFRDTNSLPQPSKLTKSLHKTIQRISLIVIKECITLGNKGVSLSVEGIQDLVEVTLMKNNFHKVARDYIIYRDSQNQKRKLTIEPIYIYRKDLSTRVRFNPMKITKSLEKCFSYSSDEHIIKAINSITKKVHNQVKLITKENKPIDLFIIQDFIEQFLMEAGFYKEAKSFIVKRISIEGDGKDRQEKEERRTNQKSFTVKTKNKKKRKIHEDEIRQKIEYASKDFTSIIDTDALIKATLMNFYEGMKEEEIDTAMIMAARSKVENDPCYSFITSRLLLDKIYRETMEISAMDNKLQKTHINYFKKYIKMGISQERLSPELLDFDLDLLGSHLKLERDLQFQYLGLQTVYDRYLIHYKEQRIETPQIFWMRVAMGLSLKEKDKNQKAIEFYDLISQFLYCPGTPTLFNSGTSHSQLSSCYLATISDDLENIFKVISDDAQLSKWAGGIGNDWTNVRATGSLIKGTNGKSQGVIPFLKVANDTAVAVNQGGKRKGAMCAYLETWHLDIEDFIELRKNTGDERRRTHDMNTSNWIPDLFMKRVQEEGSWTLFTPAETEDLHDLYGQAFQTRYEEYEEMAKNGEITHFKTVNALDLWRKMLSMIFETGHPWVTFKDPCNIRSPQDHVGVVHCSNLCTEITLNNSKEETAVCNIGSINLVNHIKDGAINKKQLSKTIKTAIRMLDNVIDVNFYPIPEAERANKMHRAVGIGQMGFQDVLYMMKKSYASFDAIELSDQISEMISYYTILSSSELAKERGTYSTYKGSKWDRGLLPIDTIDLLEKERGIPLTMDRSTSMDWSKVRASVKKHGMRNSNTMAIAPTATIANIVGVTSSIEPTYKNLFVKSNLSGEFTVPNRYLIEILKENNLWNPDLLDDLKYYDGSIQEIPHLPKEIKKLFVTAFEIDPEWILECGSRRQKWIDQAQSLNLYLSEPSGKKLHHMYTDAWKKGLKTTYYLRSLGATQIEKSTTDINKRGVQPKWMKHASASSRVNINREETPKSCSMEEGCESCQ